MGNRVLSWETVQDDSEDPKSSITRILLFWLLFVVLTNKKIMVKVKAHFYFRAQLRFQTLTGR